MSIEPAHRSTLLQVARVAIIGRLEGDASPAPPQGAHSCLSEPGASFVTLTTHGMLRGCCGSIEPSRPLLEDVWLNAQRTAFEDPRFPPLRREEAGGALLEISVLGPLEPLHVDGQQALLQALRPGVDGLLMVCGTRRATFLPKVWEKLPEPQAFLSQLKRKMGVSESFWDADLRLHRYVTEEFGAQLVP